MSDAERLAGLVATWKDSIDDFVALLRSLPQDAADLPTDLPGWSVRDVASHTAHLEAVLAGGPEETIEVLPAEHLTSPMAYYTEQGVLARKGRTLVELADEIEQAAVIRYRDLTTNPPTDAEASTRKTPGDIGWTDTSDGHSAAVTLSLSGPGVVIQLETVMLHRFPGMIRTLSVTNTSGVPATVTRAAVDVLPLEPREFDPGPEAAPRFALS
ncbi:MAG TPA: maleylpyruvate isomerase N-terminal domain-containing protein, partial [Marmoricola sp.]|nr:maleylpyruvate isomerase N-terminal domain-containing protein [Marmoricola sp.]